MRECPLLLLLVLSTLGALAQTGTTHKAPQTIAATAPGEEMMIEVPRVDPASFPALIVQGASETKSGDAATLSVIPLDKDGRSPLGLSATDFSVTVDGKPAPITHCETAYRGDNPIAVELLVDVSGSMMGTKIREARRAAISFVDKLHAQDRVGVITFGDRPVTEINLTADKAAVERQIQRIQVPSELENTATFDAIGVAMDSLKNIRMRKTIILLTDGEEQGSVLREENLTARTDITDIPLFPIIVGQGIHYDPLQRLAFITHGKIATTAKPDELGRLYENIWQQLDDPCYRLSVSLPSATEQLAWKTVVTWNTPYAGVQESAEVNLPAEKRAFDPKLLLLAMAILLAPIAIGYGLKKHR